MGVILLGASLTIAINHWQQTTPTQTKQPKQPPTLQDSPPPQQTDEGLPKQLNEEQWLAQLTEDDLIDDQLLQETSAEFNLDVESAAISPVWKASYVTEAENVPLDERITEKKSVAVDKEQLENKQAGDKLSFDLPGGYR